MSFRNAVIILFYTHAVFTYTMPLFSCFTIRSSDCVSSAKATVRSSDKANTEITALPPQHVTFSSAWWSKAACKSSPPFSLYFYVGFEHRVSPHTQLSRAPDHLSQTAALKNLSALMLHIEHFPIFVCLCAFQLIASLSVELGMTDFLGAIFPSFLSALRIFFL